MHVWVGTALWGRAGVRAGTASYSAQTGWEAFGVAKVEEGRLLPGLYLLEQNRLSHFTVLG